MKFKKINLDESLFDDYEVNSDADHASFWDEFDDDFSEIDYEKIADLSSPSQAGPDFGVKTGIADEIISLINGEWETISSYNTIVEMLRANIEAGNQEEFESMLPVLNDIVNEENKHVGQLQEILKLISPNVSYVRKGEEEGRSQLKFVNGKLPVQIMEQVHFTRDYTPHATPSQDEASANAVSEECSLLDVDDEI